MVDSDKLTWASVPVVAVGVFNLDTAEFKAHRVTANVSRVMIFGLHSWFNSRELA